MGGATQPQAQAQVLINIIDFGMNLQEAGDAPRIVHSGSSQPSGSQMKNGGTVSLESAFDEKTRKQLVGMGHKLKYEKGSFGGYQAIMKKNGVFFAPSPFEAGFISSSHSKKDLTKTINTFKDWINSK